MATDPSGSLGRDSPGSSMALLGGAIAIAVLLAAAILISAFAVIGQMRARSMADRSRDLQNLALVLSEQADRAFQALEIAQLSIINEIAPSGAALDQASFAARVNGPDFHGDLRNKISGIPYVDAMALIDASGKVLNFSHYWPAPDINVADRDYFKALSAPSSPRVFVSEPVRSRGSGNWTIYLAHKLRAPDGSFVGLVLGGMQPSYFEGFFGAIDLGAGSEIALTRFDGKKLVASPPPAPPAPETAAAVPASVWSWIEDRDERLSASRLLTHYPVAVTVSAAASAIVADWRRTAGLILAGAVSLCMAMAAGLLLIIRQIRTQHRYAAEASYAARHDSLTGLPNRLFFMEELRSRLLGARQIAVLLLDLDYFKTVNDTLGHPVGDALLNIVGHRISSVAGRETLVARLSGDEFALLADAAPGADPRDVAERVLSRIRQPCAPGDHQVVATASIGIACAPEHGADADVLLKNADLALYAAKEGGRDLICEFRAELAEIANLRRTLELDLRAALTAGALQVFYQPIVDARTREISGFEALSRWTHPVQGSIPPSTFIPLAEETGLIIALGSQVLQKACLEARNWPQHLRLSVNLSPVQLRSGTLESTVKECLSRSGLAAHRLDLEITESAILQDNPRTRSALESLRADGIGISLDDFGTGYSSLSYVRRYRPDRIKIDRTFVSEMEENAETLLIVRAIIDMAFDLGMATTAEGVETAEQCRLLTELGCTELQGYLFSPPRPAEELSALLYPVDAVQRSCSEERTDQSPADLAGGPNL